MRDCNTKQKSSRLTHSQPSVVLQQFIRCNGIYLYRLWKAEEFELQADAAESQFYDRYSYFPYGQTQISGFFSFKMGMKE